MLHTEILMGRIRGGSPPDDRYGPEYGHLWRGGEMCEKESLNRLYAQAFATTQTVRDPVLVLREFVSGQHLHPNVADE